MASKPDISIRGAGIFGLSCAWELARRGARVDIVDPHGIGAGASGGLVGALAPHAPERWTATKAFQLNSLLAARGFWQDVQETGGSDPGYARTGRLQPIADDAALDRAETRAREAATLWTDRAQWQVIAATEAGDWAPSSATGLLIRDTLSARLAPARACDALAAALTKLGAGWSLGPDALRPADAPVTLWATGAAGLDALSRDVGREAGRGIKGQAALLDHARPMAPQLFVDGLYVVPHGDGTTAIGSTTERDFADPQTTDALLDGVIARARAAVPALGAARVLRRWAGLRPRARTRAPILGAWPGRPGHFVANGGFKIGFGMAPGVARTMADLLLEERDTVPEDFRITASL